MNWIATNVRLSKDHYDKLKLRAVRDRKSVAAIIREATQQYIDPQKSNQERQKKARELIARVKKLAKENARYTKGFDSVKALREIRYGR